MNLAVVFPGIGYHTDKPLLYYSKKPAASLGFEIKEVSYGDIPADVKGSSEKMNAAFSSALARSEAILKDTDFSACGRLLFISKSLGTVVSTAFAGQHDLKTENIFFTPVDATFSLLTQHRQDGIVFHGTKDPWIKTSVVSDACERLALPLFLTKNGNHSLETGDVVTDLKNLCPVMEEIRRYIKTGACSHDR